MLADQDIGGGTVQRTFKLGTEQVFAGKKLTGEQILAIPALNRRALIEKGYVSVYPANPNSAIEPGQLGGQRHVVSCGFGKFDVIEGRKLNSAPLTKDEAMTLAGKSKPAKKKQKTRGSQEGH